MADEFETSVQASGSIVLNLVLVVIGIVGLVKGAELIVDAAIFIGYHAGTTWMEGVRAHTMSSARLADVRLNGVSVPEAGINAAVAGHFGVPVIMVSGDEAAVEEARALLGEVEAAVVKHSISFHAARTLTPKAAQDLIRTAAERAVRGLPGFLPYRPSSPVTIDVRFKNYRPSQVLALLPMFERTDAHSVRFGGSDILEASKVLRFLLEYGPDLEP